MRFSLSLAAIMAAMLPQTILAQPISVAVSPATGLPAGGASISIGNTYSIPSTVFNGERRITVRLPPGYVEQPEKRFPVVYVIDGGPEQDFIHIAGIAQSRDMNYSFDRFILIGIETINRRSEISPPVRPEALEEYKTSLGAVPGGSEKFRHFIARDVKPWVEVAFRTNGHNAVMGESLAGLFVLETLIRQPNMFDDWIAVSPSLWYDNMQLARGAADSFKAMASRSDKERIYISLANEGYRHEEGVERFVDALKSSAPEGWKWAYVPLNQSETHGTIYHTAALDAFRLLYGTPTREYRPDGEILGHEADPHSAEEQALLDEECTADNSVAATPGSAAMGRDRLFYRCLQLDLGPIARDSNWGR